MSKILLHTPEGVRDIYGNECEKKLVIEESINRTFNRYGYRRIQTPTFEFFDIFNKERGSVPSKNLYKFFDREGNTLVLRPDMTPSIARAVSKYYTDVSVPVKLCYSGSTFVNNSELQGKLKEQTQMGCELIGDDSVDADAEIISLVIESMINVGLKEFQVEIGHAGFLRSILDESGLSDEDEEELKNLIEQKNNFGVSEMLYNKNISDEAKNVLFALPEMFGSAKILKKAKDLTGNKNAIEAIERLEKLYELLAVHGFAEYVSFDLGMLSNYKYYTGVIFKTYTYGTGDMIVTGGRYNELLEQFGKKASAIGFGIYLDRLLVAMARQNVEIETRQKNMLVVYSDAFREETVGLAGKLRNEGWDVNLVLKNEAIALEEYEQFAKNSGITEIRFLI